MGWRILCAGLFLCLSVVAGEAFAAPQTAKPEPPANPPANPLLKIWREALDNSYLALRAGLQFYPDADGASAISGYSPMPENALTLNGAYNSQLELSGFGSFVLGTNYGPRSLLRGRLRQEYAFGYRSYENRVCFRVLPDNPMPRAAETQAEAQALLDEQLVARCPRQSDYVWTFLLNTHYDLPVPRLPAALHLGFGIGYLLATNRIGFQRIAEDEQEPFFANGMLQFGSNADKNEDDANPRLADRLNRTRGNHTELAAPDLVGSGLFVPLYAGVSWRMDDISGLPITLEMLYHYAAHAPRGFQETHAISWGGRYRF